MTDYITGDSFTIAVCPSCGLGLTDPVPASLERYYPRRYRRFNRVTAEVLRGLYQGRVAAWVRRIERSGLALEIGCGEGWMLHALRERGWRVIGSERTADAAALASRVNAITMFVGDIDAVQRGPVLDLIIMFHVLEHLADPMHALRSSADRLRSGGHLVIGVPNRASWQARLFGPGWFHLDVPRHLAHFEPATMRTALRSAGLDIVGISFSSFEHDPYGWVQSALDRIGFERELLLKVITGMERRTGLLGTALMLMLAVPLTVIGVVLALVSWPARRGAVMEVWASKP